MDAELTDLERSVLAIALEATDELAGPLKQQINAARVSSRTPSGVGFMTKLKVPDGLKLGDQQADVSLPTVLGAHPQLPAGAEFVLQIKAGQLNTIEAFSYEGMWPGDESQFRLRVKK